MDSELSPLGNREYEQIRDLAYQYCGLDLRSGKEELVKSRLGKKLRQLGLTSYAEYCKFVTMDTTGEALVSMIDALTTNHTNFFREPQHFVLLRKLVQQMKADGCAGSDLRIWSAACSTGEEPYTLAFILLQELGPGCLATLLATDISTRALEVATGGRYAAERFHGLSLPELSRFLLRGEKNAEGWYLVRKEVRRMVEFRRLNLMEIPPSTGSFRMIFCRNVMIYFDQPTQERLVGRLVEHLEPGGHLFVGHSESLNSIRHSLEYVCPAVYRNPGGNVSPDPHLVRDPLHATGLTKGRNL